MDRPGKVVEPMAHRLLASAAGLVGQACEKSGDTPVWGLRPGLPDQCGRPRLTEATRAWAAFASSFTAAAPFRNWARTARERVGAVEGPVDVLVENLWTGLANLLEQEGLRGLRILCRTSA